MEKFEGLLLKESLVNLNILKEITITKEEKWDIDNAADFQPKVWTAIFFEGDGDKVEDIVGKMSKVIKKVWYLNISLGDTEYVVFYDKFFKYEKNDIATKQKAQEYAISVGIPENQVDW